MDEEVGERVTNEKCHGRMSEIALEARVILA